jgi:hypothetical protein
MDSGLTPLRRPGTADRARGPVIHTIGIIDEKLTDLLC